MALTESKVKKAVAGPKLQKLFDGHGLFLAVLPSGGKSWRLKYRFGGKEQTYVIGMFPVIGLQEARERAQEAKKEIINGVNPNAKKQEEAQRLITFGEVARACFKDWGATSEKDEAKWTVAHTKRLKARLRKYLLPALKDRPFKEITAQQLLELLKAARSTSLEMSMRVKILANQIWSYGVIHGYASYNIVPDLKGAIPTPRQKHYAAVTDPFKVASLLKILDGYHGQFVTKCALELAPLVFLRPGELRGGVWSEIDFEEGIWNIEGSRMKMGVAHLVPLSTQALAILKKLHRLTGNGTYLFPSQRSRKRCLSENTINAALRCLGIDPKTEMTGHGFRAMARTIMAERLGYRPDILEHQLAHKVKDANGNAYNRTSFLDYRRFMMQDWADYLDLLRTADPKTAATAILSRANGRPLPLY